MSFKTRDGKTHQSSVLVSESGLPFDGIATISGRYVFLDGNQPLTYSASTVTLPAGFDLTEVSTAKARYTGKYVLIANDGKIYYIDRSSIDIINRTFSISVNDKLPVPPALIDLSAGWTVAEADIVNRMATTSAAKIDSVEFRDIHFQMQLDGDPVSLINQDGVGINPATEEKQDDQIVELGLINDELDTHTIQLNQINLDLNSQFDQTQLQLDGVNQRLDNIDSRIDGPNSTITPLANGAIFYGPWTKRAAPSVLLASYSDRNFSFYLQYANSELSQTLGVPVYTAGFSQGIEASVPYSYVAGVTPPTPRRLILSREYYRVVVVNNSGFDMTELSVQTSIGDFQPAITRLSDGVMNDSDAELVRSVSTGEDPNGLYGNDRLSGVSNSLSTSTPLLAGQTFDSGWFDVSRYASAGILVKSDVLSDTLGLKFELSSGGVTVDSDDIYTYKAAGGKVYVVPLVGNFFRIRYVNGLVNQTSFVIQTKLYKETLIASSHRINDVIIDEDDAQLVKSVISAQDPAGVFQNIKSSGNGNMLVAVGDRPAEVRNRVRVEARIFNTALTGTPVVLHTVTPGKILYVESMIISAVNQANAVGEWRIANGATDKLGYLLAERAIGAGAAISASSPSLPEPIPFTTNFNVREISGDISLSIYFIGYEE